MTNPTVVRLDGMVLPETGPLRRHVRPVDRRSALYEERYDRRTLVYDAVRDASGDRVLLTTPRLLNLWPVLRDGLRADGATLVRSDLRRKTALRFEQLFIRGRPERLSVDVNGTSLPLELRESGAPLFHHRRVLMAVNRDNPLDWIADWARFHAARHGADGVLLFDNGSQTYSVGDLGERLATVPGIARAVIVSAPFPYGPADRGGRFDVPPRFFQTAMFNLARRDLLSKARSVLSVDIDEMVDGPEGESVFAATEAHPLGMVTLPGIWVFPSPGTNGPVPQREHRWLAVPPEPCHQKWCIAPAAPMGRVVWNVHKLGGILQPLFTVSRRFRLLHCRSASTGWKPDRFAHVPAVSESLELGQLFDGILGRS